MAECYITRRGGGNAAVTAQAKTASASTSQQVITPDSGYDYLSQVTINAVTTQDKTVTPASVQQVVTPDAGYDYLSQVTVDASEGFTFTTAGLCQYPSTVTIPEYVTSLSNSPRGFTGHTEIIKLIIAPRETQLGFATNACQGCTNLADIEIPDGVSIVLNGGTVFANCAALTNESANRIMTHTTTIPGFTFQYSGITDIVIPANITTFVGDGAFGRCSNLKNAVVNTSTIGRLMFAWDSALESVTIPDTVTDIPQSAFGQCTSLTSFVFPSSLTTIGLYAFDSDRSLTEIDLPASLTTVYSSSFSGCTGIKKVTLRSVPTVSGGAWGTTANPFASCTALEEFNIPEGWNVDLRLAFSNALTHDTLVDIIDNLYDFSGGTAHTLTIGSTNLAKLSESEIAVAAAKNWTVS